MKEKDKTEVLSLIDIDEKKKKEEELLKKEKQKLDESVKDMQEKIRQSNDILFSILKISIFFLISVIIIIIIRRMMG